MLQLVKLLHRSHYCSHRFLQSLGYAGLANLPPQYGLCKLSGVSAHPLSGSFILLLVQPQSDRWIIYTSYRSTPSSQYAFSVSADTDIIPPLAYAIFGSSRHIAVGPTAVISLLTGSQLTRFISGDPDLPSYSKYLTLAHTATFYAGLIQFGMGILR